MTEPATDAPSWRPVVTDPAQRERTLTVIREIAAALAARPLPDEGLDALVDRAVLRTYLAQDGVFADDDDAGGSDLAAAVTRFGQGGYPPSLFAGASRVGWGVAHLAGGDEAAEACTAIEQALMRRLEDTPWTHDYDLIVGLTGIGVYALERADTESGRRLAARVLDHLEQLARPIGGGLGWHTSPSLLPDWQRKLAPDGYWNLGLAHGIPGPIALFARMIANDVEAARARPLLDGAVAYLLGVAAPDPDGRYAGWLPSAEGGSTRLAWCYGDLGVSLALVSAAQATGEVEWRTQGLELARLCASRTFAQAHVRDAGLCHGTAGAMHCFNRLWHATGEAVFADAARAWVDHTLAIRNEQPIAGYPAAAVDEVGNASWEAEESLLAGASGVGLALHAAVSEVEPSWDRLLLVDLAIA